MHIIAYDLGTGGVKASLYDEQMQTKTKSFIEYPTFYPKPGYHEQRPLDWWDGVVRSTHALLESSGVAAEDIACVSLSGHSLVAVPIGNDLSTLSEYVPIWSDTRATEQAQAFFRHIPEETWYMTTGNGFPAPLYMMFKIMWLKRYAPDIYSRTYKVLGSKDYINFKLTGRIATDFSYASGSGAYDLNRHILRGDFLEAAEIDPAIFPEIVASHTILGQVTPQAARETGLCPGVKVVCGGVDNACMALGAVGQTPNRVYTSLGSSSWIPVNSQKPALDFATRPYVFEHIADGMYTSAYSIFAGGSSFQWIRDTLCKDFCTEKSAYDQMSALAAQSPIGANGIYFNPSLAGGTSQDKSTNIRGAFVGLRLGTSREDLIRAAMEGIALNLKTSLQMLEKLVPVEGDILFTGGGSKSSFWMQMFADVFQRGIRKTNIDQDAASLGAAAISARGLGWWNDYSGIDGLHQVAATYRPDPASVKAYDKVFSNFVKVNDTIADLCDALYAHAGA